MNPPVEILGIAIGAITLGAALMVVTARVPIHAACFLILTLFGVAAEYVVLEAHAIAIFQILVYAGAIVVLIAFVLMLMGSGPKEVEPMDIKSWRVWVGMVMTFLIIGLFAYGTVVDRIGSTETPVDPVRFGRLESLGEALLGSGEHFGAGGYLLPFEIISLVLMVGVVGAVALLRKPPAKDGEEVEQ
jgi:NADH-quinone oxidoreductase subunit J